MYLQNSIGIELQDGSMFVCISKNTALPISRTQVLFNCKPHLYTGERLIANDNEFLGSLDMEIEKHKKVILHFEINERGRMMTNIKHMNTNILKEYNVSVTSVKVKCQDAIDTILNDCDIFEEHVLQNEIMELCKTFNIECDLSGLSLSQLKNLKNQFEFS